MFERSPRAHRYRLTLRRDGVAVATIPARGSQREAERLQEMAEKRRQNAHRRTFAPVGADDMKKAMDREAQQARRVALLIEAEEG